MLPLWHNVTEGHFFVDGVLDRHADEPLGALGADGLDADAGAVEEHVLAVAHLAHECHDLFGALRTRLELDAAVHVLGVLAENTHVHFVGVAVGRVHALEILHRADAAVEVEAEAQVHINAAEAAADGGGQRPLEAEGVVLERPDGVVGQVDLALAVLVEALDLVVGDVGVVEGAGGVAGVDLEPIDFLFSAVALLDRGVDDLDGASGDAGDAVDIRADAVALEQADDGVVGDLPLAGGRLRGAGAGGRGGELLVGGGHRASGGSG